MLKIQDAVQDWALSCPEYATNVSTKRVTDVVVVFSPRNAASVARKVSGHVIVIDTVIRLGVPKFIVPFLVVSATSKKFLSIEKVERKISILSVSFISNFDLYSSL